jgi:serine/threonine protein kinase
VVREWIKQLTFFVVRIKVTDKFKFIKVLGKGAFAKVHLAIKGHNQDKKYAVKSIKKNKVLESSTGKEDIK